MTHLPTPEDGVATAAKAARFTPAGAQVAAALLERLTPDTAAPHRLTIAAAICHSTATADPKNRIEWSGYADRASRQLFGPAHPMSLRAAAVHARVLGEQGHTAAAVDIHAERVAVLEQAGGGAALIAGHRQLADALHADRRCADAEARIHQALRLWHSRPGDVRAGRDALVSYAAILAGCGDIRRAGRLLRGHPDLLPAAPAEVALAAERIVAAELHHPPQCARHPTQVPISPAEAQRRLTAWQQVLAPATAGGWAPAPPAHPHPCGRLR